MTAKITLTGASPACKASLSWQELPWQKIQRQVLQLQLRIAKAEREEERKKRRLLSFSTELTGLKIIQPY